MFVNCTFDVDLRDYKDFPKAFLKICLQNHFEHIHNFEKKHELQLFLKLGRLQKQTKRK